MTAITASSRRMMPTRQPIRMAVLLLSSLATGRPGLGVLAAKSGPRKKKSQKALLLACAHPLGCVPVLGARERALASVNAAFRL